jgi:hypothetical protein
MKRLASPCLGVFVVVIALCLASMGMDIAMTGIAEIRHHGHTLADLDRDVNAWVAARQKYIASADCGSLAGDACKEHYQIEVVPNLKATELAWAAVQGQLDFMLAHGSVPPRVVHKLLSCELRRAKFIRLKRRSSPPLSTIPIRSDT